MTDTILDIMLALLMVALLIAGIGLLAAVVRFAWV